jgi:hypothetical protein
MAYKTSASQGLNTALIDVIAHMTFRAIIHFHAIPGIKFDPRDVFAPDIPAVARNPIGFIRLEALRLTDVAMAGNTVHLPHLDMGHMGEKYAVRLPGIHQPGHFSVFENVLVDEFGLLFTFPLDLFMAINALSQLRDPGIGAVFPEKMTAFATVIDLLVVQKMIKLNRLLFPGVKKLREDDPPEHQAGHQPEYKKQGNGTPGTLAGFGLLRVASRVTEPLVLSFGGNLVGFVLCAHRNSVALKLVIIQA